MAQKYAQFQYWSAVAHGAPQHNRAPESFEVKIAGVTYTQRNHVIATPRTPTNKRLRPRQTHRAARHYVRAGQAQQRAFRYHHLDVAEEGKPWLQGLDLGVGGTVVARQMVREEVWERMASREGFAESTGAQVEEEDVQSVVQYELEEDEGRRQEVVGTNGAERDGEGGAMGRVRKQWKRTTRAVLAGCRGLARAWVG